MDEADLRMAVDPFSVLDGVAEKAGGHIRGRVVYEEKDTKVVVVAVYPGERYD
jgi:hypothetical protein